MSTPTPTPHRIAGTIIVAVLLAGMGGCKPSVPPTAGNDQPRQKVNSPSPADAKHRPEADDLARFLRGTLPPFIKLIELKSDPPAPLLGTASSNNAWSYNVRVIFAPPEDVLRPTAPKDAVAFRSAVDELNALATWSQAYAHSPYAAHHPGFSVEPPVPAHPLFLAVAHLKDKPLAPLYGKMSAEWQVDHWSYTVVSLQDPPDEPGKLRSQYTGPILIQGSPEAQRFMAQVEASLNAARPKKAAIDAAYHADLLKTTRPGTIYKGTLTHGKNVLPAEARFVPVALGDTPGAVQMEFRLFNPEYVYRCSVRLADSPPVQSATATDEVSEQIDLTDEVTKPMPKADLALGYLGVTDPKRNSIYSPSGDFRSATMSRGADDKFWLNVQNGHLAGKMTLYDFDPPYFFDGQQTPQ